MEKVLVIVEMSDNNYSCYCDALLGCVATGATFEELRKNMNESVESHLEMAKEYGDEIPDVFNSEFELSYKFEPQSLLMHYKGIFTNSALEKLTGINQRQLQRYASGKSVPRPEQIEKLSNGFHFIGSELLSVQL